MEPMSTEIHPVPSRVLSIDILRGITIALMILVNDAGDWTHVYRQLEHSPWNGCTLTDLVFPSFLFLVGASTILSIQARLARGASRAVLARRVVRRSLTIFAVDLFLGAFPYFHLTQLRLYGVLTRIALCYLFVGLLTLITRRIVVLLLLAATILVGYWALLRFVPVPGYGHPGVDVPFLDRDGNLVAWLDRGINAFLQRTVHTGRLYEGTRDPEGLLSTVPALAQTLIGAVVALWLVRTRHPAPPIPFPSSPPDPAAPSSGGLLRRWYPRTEEHRRDGLLAFGLALLLLGLVWDHWFPLNKKLWTSSFVLFTTGCSTIVLSALYWLYDVRHLQRGSRLLRLIERPALIFGSNAITSYIVSELLVEIMVAIRVPVGNLPQLPPPPPPNQTHHNTPRRRTNRHLFARTQSTDVTSLLFAIAVVVVCFIPNYILWRKKIFLRL